jgi:hypothetical protein
VTLESCGLEPLGLNLDRVRGEIFGRHGPARGDAFGEQKPERELLVVPRGAHRHRHWGAIDADLQRLLDGDRVLLPALIRQPDDLDPSSRVRRRFHRAAV